MNCMLTLFTLDCNVLLYNFTVLDLVLQSFDIFNAEKH